jgi:hypothetical protein
MCVVRYSKLNAACFLARRLIQAAIQMISRVYLRSVLSLHKTYFEKAESATRVRGAKNWMLPLGLLTDNKNR